MQKNKILYWFIPPAVIAAAMIFSSCWFLDPASEIYRIKIDSFFVPNSVVSGDPVTIKLWGKIGDDTCHSFSHFQSVQDSSGLELAAWGFYNPAYRKGCPGADVQLGGKEYSVTPYKRGTFTVTIRQPDGTYWKKYIEVN